MGYAVADLEAMKAQAAQSFKLATSDTMRREMEKDVETLVAQIEEAKGERNKLEVHKTTLIVS